MTVLDDRGRSFGSSGAPARVVSLVPSISETLWHLGIGPRLVGVTRYCTDPVEVRSLPVCGGTKNPVCAQVIELRPDLVFMSEEENRLEDFETLAAAGISIFVSLPKSIDDTADWVRRVGAAVGCGAAAESMGAAIEHACESTRARVAARGQRRRVFCPIWKKPWMSFNADTYADAVLRLCGGDNVFAAASERYCTVTLEEAAAGRPEVVLLPDEPYPFADRHVNEVQGVLDRTAPGHARVVDGQALSWYGARTPNGLRIIEAAIFGGEA